MARFKEKLERSMPYGSRYNSCLVSTFNKKKNLTINTFFGRLTLRQL